MESNQKGGTNQNQNGTSPFIWYAPEVLEEQENSGGALQCKYSEKSDVYSFGMVCFELLTGKVPFEDSHLQGEKMSRNIRAGERPLFSLNSPKYVINLTKKCWHTDLNQRPSFSSICRILRYIKRFLAMNHSHITQLEAPAPTPAIDYCDIETALLKKFPTWGNSESTSISQIPFQMFSYRVAEREKTGTYSKENSESGSDASACGDDLATSGDEAFISSTNEKKICHVLVLFNAVTPRSARPPQMSSFGRPKRTSSDQQTSNSRTRRTASGHVSDSELS